MEHSEAVKFDVREAAKQLPHLLELVERGVVITITRNGQPVAKLVNIPANVPKPDVAEAIAKDSRAEEEDSSRKRWPERRNDS